MASTNKTPHLGLCQWVETDPLLMDDMNDTLKTIDKAIGIRPLVKLMEVTLTQSLTTVNLDLSEIDFTNIVDLQIYFPTGSAISINHFTGALNYLGTTGGWQSSVSTFGSSDGKINITNINGLASTKGNIYMSGSVYYYVEASKIGPLESLTFTNNRSYSEGDRFLILGIRL